jgi:hypothetical protein
MKAKSVLTDLESLVRVLKQSADSIAVNISKLIQNACRIFTDLELQVYASITEKLGLLSLKINELYSIKSLSNSLGVGYNTSDVSEEKDNTSGFDPGNLRNNSREHTTIMLTALYGDTSSSSFSDDKAASTFEYDNTNTNSHSNTNGTANGNSDNLSSSSSVSEENPAVAAANNNNNNTDNNSTNSTSVNTYNLVVDDEIHLFEKEIEEVYKFKNKNNNK